MVYDLESENHYFGSNAQFFGVLGFALSQGFQTPWAKVIVAPLEHAGIDILPKRLLQIWNIFFNELVLQINCVR